jgi:hypothetical protein
MRRSLLASVLAIVGFCACGSMLAADPTHMLQPVILEVAPTQASGNPWDTGIGSFGRPDPQVTLMRHDEAALRATTALFVQASEKRMNDLEKKMKDLGGPQRPLRPVPPQLKALVERDAMQALSCGVTVEALSDKALTTARAKFISDTPVAKDSLLAKFTTGGLPVKVGDKVTIFVNEVDLAAHDKMGETDLDVTKELVTKGEVELKFEQVSSLRLKLVPITK